MDEADEAEKKLAADMVAEDIVNVFALFEASDRDEVSQALAFGATVNQQDTAGNTPLIEAIKNKK